MQSSFTSVLTKKGRNTSPIYLLKVWTQIANKKSILIKQDYYKLENKLDNYSQVFETQELERVQTGGSAITVKNFVDPIKDLFDSDKALEQLLETSNKKKKNMATEFFDARSNAIESVLSQDLKKWPVSNTHHYTAHNV